MTSGVKIEFAQEKLCSGCREEFTGPSVHGFLSRGTQGAVSIYYHPSCADKLQPEKKTTKAKCRVSGVKLHGKEYYLLDGRVFVEASCFRKFTNQTEQQTYKACLDNASATTTYNDTIRSMPDGLASYFKVDKIKASLLSKKEKEDLAEKQAIEALLASASLDNVEVTLDYYGTSDSTRTMVNAYIEGGYEVKIGRTRRKVKISMYGGDIACSLDYNLKIKGPNRVKLLKDIVAKISSDSDASLAANNFWVIDTMVRKEQFNKETLVNKNKINLRAFANPVSALYAFDFLFSEKDPHKAAPLLLLDENPVVRKFGERLYEFLKKAV